MSFLEKQVRRERTGANIAGITEDVNTASMINPRGISGAPIKAVGTMPVYQMDILDSIERVAQEADKARIANEKIKLNIDLENARLDLEERWAERHDKFSNTDVYNEYLEDKKKLLAEQEKLILSSKYMTKDEKAFAVEKNKIAYREDYAKTASKRNEVVVGQTIDDSKALREQIATMAKSLGIHDDKKAEEYYTAIAEQINVVGNLTGMSGEERAVIFAKEISKIDATRQQNYLEEMMINRDMPWQEKIRQLNDLKALFNNKELMTQYAKKYASLFKTEDEEQTEKYLYSVLTDENSRVVKMMTARFKEAEAQQKREIADAMRVRKMQENLTRIEMQMMENKAYNTGSYESMENAITKKTSKGVRFEDRIAGENEAEQTGNIFKSRIYGITGKTPKEVNTRGEYIHDYLSDQAKANMTVDIVNAQREGKSSTQALIDTAKTYAGGSAEMTQILVNSYTQGGEMNGYTKAVDVLLEAERGNAKAQVKKTFIQSIERKNNIIPNLKQETIEEYAGTVEGMAIANKLKAKGVPDEIARMGAAKVVASERAAVYMKGTNLAEVTENDLIAGVTKKNEKEARLIITKNAGNETYIESLADTLTPRKRMKQTALEGSLKIN